jgi:hypothetical protein
MNYIKHLTGFFDKVIQDRYLNPTHISLYIALFQQWNINRFQNPISITRDEMMRISKIASKATYHKCIRELSDKGFLKYEPSFNPYRGSMVFLFNFSDEHKPVKKRERNEEKNEPIIEQVLVKLQTAHETTSSTSTEQALVPSINYINNTNNSNISKLENKSKLIENFEMQKAFGEKEKKINKPSQNENSISKNDENQKQKKLREKNKEFTNPTFDQVKIYFLENNFPELEAYKFYNYFASIGWLVGGKIPMVDWQAASQNWILNTSKFISNDQQSNRAKHLNTGTDKDYSEPL